MKIDVVRRRRLRSEVLRRIYDIVDGHLSDSTGVPWQHEEIYRGFEVDPDEIEKALNYLADARLLEERPIGVYGLTRRGLDEIEDLIAAPEKSTAHLSPLIVQHIHNSGQLAIAQGRDITIAQTGVQSNLPRELLELANQLSPLIEANQQQELEVFLKAAAEGTSKFELAARAEPLAKEEGVRSVLKAFSDEIAKELGKHAVAGTVAGGTWLAVHGPVVYEGLTMLLKTLHL
ncbi:hypothetical protein [Fimbriimonas ginsengisoli]|uniref:hypothetical protein n=1 Tax=Fimbriimonas ginsengisoli TaxID=1005039 RepID=UPI00046CA13B|nr:hypothetical protein [Fimbriimonas ginsengisoli]